MPRTSKLALAALAALTLAAQAAPETDPDRFRADEVIYSGVIDAAMQEELKPIHTMDGVVACLQRHHLSVRRKTVTLPIGLLPEQLWTRVDALPKGEPLIIQQGANGGVVLVILDRHLGTSA